MPQAEIVLDALTAAVDEIDQEIVRVLQRAGMPFWRRAGPIGWTTPGWR